MGVLRRSSSLRAPTLPLGHAPQQAGIAELRAKLASLAVKAGEARLGQAGAEELLVRLRREAREEERAAADVAQPARSPQEAVQALREQIEAVALAVGLVPASGAQSGAVE